MSEEREVDVDVAVVGAGPAGMAAAVAARRAGAEVAVVDEYGAPGGQIWRRPFREEGLDAPPSLPAAGRRACAELAGTGVELLARTSVWGSADPRTLLLTGPGGESLRLHAKAVVLATGAYDRPVAFPGWTLPGVMTAGAAQALAKGQGLVPGKRVLLAGAGPFLLPVATQLAECGAEVVAVVEATRRREWLRAAPRMAAHGSRLAEYARYRTRVPRIVWGHVIVRAEGDGRVRRATIAAAGPDWAPRAGSERSFEVDAVCTAYGFLPNADLARAFGCELRGDAVAHDDEMCTSVAGVFVAGEAAGVGGAELAQAEGALAGAAAARDALSGHDGDGRAHNGDGLRFAPTDLAPLQRRRAKQAAFAEILADLFDPRPGLATLPAADTVLCRCEDVTAGAVDAAVAEGTRTLAALKIVTRCGQGPCQGRVCERLVAARMPAPERFSARAPVGPIPLPVLMDQE